MIGIGRLAISRWGHRIHSSFRTARLRLRTGTVFHVMAAIMAVGALVALVGLRGGVQDETEQRPEVERPHTADTVSTVASAG